MGGAWSYNKKISREELKAGDHIYSWRRSGLHLYAHHGIYAGEGMVIHFTRAAGGVSVSSASSAAPTYSRCPICGYHSGLNGVISSCIDCFLSGDELYLYEYGVSSASFQHGINTVKPSDSPEIVLKRAEYFLGKGFRDYNMLNSNCENFAIYCKTGEGIGISGQANAYFSSLGKFMSSLTG